MSEELHRRWGRTIRIMRQAKDQREGLKTSGIEAMAAALGVTAETVSRWETGVLVPRDAKKLDIAEYLGHSPEVIFPLVREVSS